MLGRGVIPLPCVLDACFGPWNGKWTVSSDATKLARNRTSFARGRTWGSRDVLIRTGVCSSPGHTPIRQRVHALRPCTHRAEPGPGATDGGFPNPPWLWAHRGQAQPPAQSCAAPIKAKLLTKPVFLCLSEVWGLAECLMGPRLRGHPSLLQNHQVPPQSLGSPTCSLPPSTDTCVLGWAALGLGLVRTASPLNA